MCRYGQGVVRALFEEFDDENLKGITVWLPIMGGDSAETASVETDARVVLALALAKQPCLVSLSGKAVSSPGKLRTRPEPRSCPSSESA